MLALPQQAEQPDGEGPQGVQEASAVGRPVARFRAVVRGADRSHDRAAPVAEEELGFTEHRGRRVVGVGLDAAPRVAQRAVHHFLTDRPAFGVVALQQPGTAWPAHGRGDFPGQVVRVLDAGVHPLGAGGRVDVRGVPGHEDPPVPVPVDDAVADAEHGGPAQGGRGRGARGEPVEHGLDVFEAGHGPLFPAQAVRDTVRVLLPRTGQFGRGRHRHPVAVVAGQRDAHQQVVGEPVDDVRGPDARIRPADPSRPRRRPACTPRGAPRLRRTGPAPCGPRCGRRRSR